MASVSSSNRVVNNDEISLRDVYLIFRRGLPLILLASLIAGVLAFVVSSLLPKVYEAETTVLISPPAVNVEGTQNLSFRPSSEVSFEAYETLAESKGVLGEAAQNINPDLSYTDINGTVRELIGPQGAGQSAPLLVTHTVRNNNPERAIQYADAWATATLLAVQRSLFANIQPINTITVQAIEPLLANLTTAEEALETFEASDQSEALQATLNSLAGLIAASKSGVITTNQLSLAQTNEIPLSANQDDPIILNNTLQADSYFNLEQEIAAREAYLESLGGGTAQERAELAALQARQTLLQEQLTQYETDFQSTRQTLAALERQRRELELALENTQEAYQSVSRLQPMIDLVSKLSPTNARILSSASTTVSGEPEPVGPNRLLNTALAVVGVGLLALVFVFLREAVRV
jgi:capsular polysaccharide biosynthesis protein